MRKLSLATKECVFCSKKMSREQYKMAWDFKQAKYCSHECYTNDNRGEKHANWTGGIKHRPDGYLRYGRTDQYIHRVVLEEHLGRKLGRNEQVHHINGNPSDNRLKNLALTKNGFHRKTYHSEYIRNKKGQFRKV